MTARMFFGVIFCIIAIVAHAESRNCILIFEGGVNAIMVPEKVEVHDGDDGDGGYFNQWYTVNNEGNVVRGQSFATTPNEYFYTISISGQEGDLVYYSDIIMDMRVNSQSDSNYTQYDDVKFDYTGDRICPDVLSFPLNSRDSRTTNLSFATVSVAKPPLNTLCRPDEGTITGADSVEVLGTTDSLYDCATKVVERKDDARGVQWDIGGPGACRAFYGEDLQFNRESILSLACVLKCNELPILGVTPGRTEEADDFSACLHLGEEAGSDSISYVSHSTTCHLYDRTEDVKLISTEATGCYLPAKPTTTSTTTTQKSTLSTGAKAAIGIIVGLAIMAVIGAAAYLLTGKVSEMLKGTPTPTGETISITTGETTE